MGDCVTAIPERPVASGGVRPVTVDDTTRAFLRFENGATGSIEANWIATGRKMQHEFDVWGTRGALTFSQERLSELTVVLSKSCGTEARPSFWTGAPMCWLNDQPT